MFRLFGVLWRYVSPIRSYVDVILAYSEVSVRVILEVFSRLFFSYFFAYFGGSPPLFRAILSHLSTRSRWQFTTSHKYVSDVTYIHLDLMGSYG